MSDAVAVTIDLGDRAYDIRIARGLLGDPTAWPSLPRAMRMS
jgi:hypothetical protein